MRFSTAVVFAATFLGGFAIAADENWGMNRLVCDRPAVLSTCKKDCSCPGNSAQPDCSEPTCHDNCRCREVTPPPPYSKDPPPKKGGSSGGKKSSGSSKRKGSKSGGSRLGKAVKKIFGKQRRGLGNGRKMARRAYN